MQEVLQFEKHMNDNEKMSDNERLAKKMREAYEDVYALKEKYHVTYRLASYMLALSRVVEAQKTRGFLG